MDSIIILGLGIILAYIIQIYLGLKQIKHFSQVYAELRKEGRVAIGRRSGKLKSGTIVMFAINKKGTILAAKKMQGVTVAAHFKNMPDYIGQDIHYVDKYNPTVRKENKLMQIAIEDARDVFLRIEAGIYKDVPKMTPFMDLSTQIKLLPKRLKLQLKK